MSQIQISLVYNRKNKLNKNEESLIQICCYQNGKRTYFSIGQLCLIKYNVNKP